MLNKYWRLGIFGGVCVALVITTLILTRPQPVAATLPIVENAQAEAAPQQQLAGSYLWNYSAKFVCGSNAATAAGVVGEPPVKPGNYATEINIHNYVYKEVTIRKKLILLVDKGQVIGREPNAVGPITRTAVTMGPDYAMMDDCNALWALASPTTPPSTPMALMIGYLVIISPVDLDVDVVYTAEVPGTQGVAPTSISIDVERVPGKRLFIPVGALP
jgi:hypothetical protein